MLALQEQGKTIAQILMGFIGMAKSSTSFKKGQVGNPKGRPKGSKNKLGEDFLQDFTTVWNEGGIEALRLMLQERPVDFVKLAASLMPKMIDITKDQKKTIEIPWEIKTLRSTTSPALISSPSGKVKKKN
jgi:hypothetical protein